MANNKNTFFKNILKLNVTKTMRKRRQMEIITTTTIIFFVIQ